MIWVVVSISFGSVGRLGSGCIADFCCIAVVGTVAHFVVAVGFCCIVGSCYIVVGFEPVAVSFGQLVAVDQQPSVDFAGSADSAAADSDFGFAAVVVADCTPD